MDYNNNNTPTPPISATSLQTTSHPSTHYQTTIVNELLQLSPDELMEYLMDLPNTPLTDDDADLLEDYDVTGSRWMVMTRDEYLNIGLEKEATISWLIQTAKNLLSGGIIGFNTAPPNSNDSVSGESNQDVLGGVQTPTPQQQPLPHHVGVNLLYVTEDCGNVDDEYYYSDQFNQDGVSLQYQSHVNEFERAEQSKAEYPTFLVQNEGAQSGAAAAAVAATAINTKNEMIATIKASLSHNNSLNPQSTITINSTTLINPTLTHPTLVQSNTISTIPSTTIPTPSAATTPNSIVVNNSAPNNDDGEHTW